MSWQEEAFKCLGLFWQYKSESVKECSLILAEERRGISCEERALWRLHRKKNKSKFSQCHFSNLAHRDDVKCKIFSVEMWFLYGFCFAHINYVNPSISSLFFCPGVELSLHCFLIFLQILLNVVCLPLASGKEGGWVNPCWSKGTGRFRFLCLTPELWGVRGERGWLKNES